ncbi:MAG: ATP-dependent helicase [bacterium]
MALAAIITNMTNKPLSAKDSQLFLGDVKGEQLDVLEYDIEKDLLVSGPAGSGKTVLALKRYKHLVEKGMNGELLVYTNILKDYISQKTGVHSKGIFKFIKDITPVHFNDFLNRAERYLTYADDAANWARQNRNAIDFLIVDEAQDLYLSLFDFCSNYAKVLNLLADDAQQLYKHGNCTTVILGKLLKNNNRVIKRLDIKGNYRNHEVVSKMANPFYSKRNEEPFKWNTFDTRPNLKVDVIVSNSDDILNNVLIKKTGYYVDLTPQNTSKVAIITQNGVNSINNIFNPYYPTHLTNNGMYNGKNIFETADPVILTMHSVKGLEFEYVLIANLDYTRLKTEFSENYNQMIFTAMTRARHSLSIFVKDDQQEFLHLITSNVDKRYYEIIKV